MAVEGTHEMTLGIEYSSDDLDDTVNLADHEDSCESLVSCFEEEQLETADSCDIEIVSSTCRIYKYYSEETIAAVQRHFTRSFQEDFKYLLNSKMAESESPSRTKGRPKRMSKRKTVTSASPYYVPSPVGLQTHAYTRDMGAQHCNASFVVPAKVEMYKNIELHYRPPTPPHFQNRTSKYTSVTDNAPRQSAYSAFCNGKTLIEVYSPTVGRGFNPRYNSFLIEPTVHPHLPPIVGQSRAMSPTQEDIQAFLHVVIDFNIPKQ